MAKKANGLEIEEDLDFQQKEWAAQRVGWVVFALIVVLALLGLLGRGPVAKRTVETAGLQMTYPRFVHEQNPVDLEIVVAPEFLSSGEVRLWFDQDYVRTTRISHITPDPDSVESSTGRVVYTFKAADPTEPLSILMDLEADRVGSLDGLIGVDNGPELAFNQFVYP